MSTHADVTVVLTEPDKQRCSVKYKCWPVAIYKDKHYRPNEPNWFIAAPGYYFRSGDVMIFIWYDGISCFIQVKEDFTVKIGDNIHSTKHKINIRHGDIIRIRDSWKVMEKEICLKFEIFCNGEQMNVDQSNNFTDSREIFLAHKRAPQNQIPTFQPTPNSGNLWQWSEYTSTVQKLELRNSTVKTTPLENLRLQRDTAKCISPGLVTKMKNVYESKGPVERTKEPNMPVRKTKKKLNSSKSKKDLCVQVLSEQCQEYTHKEKKKTTNLKENITAIHNVSWSLASQRDTGDDELTDDNCEMDQSNIQQEGQLESEETVLIPNHGGKCDSIVYTQDHSEIDNSSCEGQPMKGVSNIGMTCYANGIFQILAQTKLFLGAIKPLVELSNRPLTNSLWKVLEEINHPSQYFTDIKVVVQKLLDVIAKYSSFSSCRQDDCLEFLLHILERLKEENQQSTSMFEMNLQTVIEHETNPDNHVDKCDIQLSYHLLVPFYREQNKDNPTVESCLNKMLNVVESFSGKELPCRYCPRTEAPSHRMAKHFVVSRSPDILILQIGRVEHMKFRTYSNLKKKTELVEYGHILNIDEVHWDGCKRMTKRNPYKLYGVVLHAGIIECGHYYSFVKHRKTSEWFYCNDSFVDQIYAGMVLNDPNAYLLFYEKIYNTMS